jgi:hypothetical protein
MGSGGRAASAVARLSLSVELHTYRPIGQEPDLYPIEALGVRLLVTPSQSEIAFAYFHPLSNPVIAPNPIPPEPVLRAEGGTILRFGCLEGDAVVTGDTVIYDPQTIIGPRSFAQNGSSAKKLAIVLNEGEIRSIAGVSDIDTAATHVMAQERASVLIVKAGIKGAQVFAPGHRPIWVPSYYSQRVFKIGSGDVFSAAFAYYWGEAGLDSQSAADLASRSAAHYCGSRLLPLPGAGQLADLIPVGSPTPAKVGVIGSARTLGSRWVLEEARWCLSELGLDVFAPTLEGQPIHSVGDAEYGAILICGDFLDDEIASAGIAAVRNKVPTVIFSETGNFGPQLAEESMCRCTDDFATAIYLTGWAAGNGLNLDPR